ncbi:MAG TPA: FAD-dependent oxidoreductase [Candidatus Binataceae bacterium]|nr:FAD-dependent oxidoreductase [Candidatus Binataceae bacterium]
MTEGTPAEPGGRPTISARIERVLDHNDDTRSLFLAPLGGARVRFVPGQFISILIPLADEVRTRPYTIASSPDDPGPIEICFNRVPAGRGAAWLFERQPGDVLAFTGPFGAFTLDRAPAAETVFIAEGTAIAPIRPMIRRATASPGHAAITLLYAARSERHLLYRAEFEELAGRDPRFKFDAIVAPQETLYGRLLDEADRRWVKADDDRSRVFYVCGIGPGVIAIRNLLRGAGYERRAVHYEQW